MRSWLALFGMIAGLSGVWADDRSEPGPMPTPVVPGGQAVSKPVRVNSDNSNTSFPAGTAVSQPLQPVMPAPEQPPKPEPPPSPEPAPKAPPAPSPTGLGSYWDDLEFLLWLPRAQPIPALVTGTHSGVAPVPGQPGTTVVLGGRTMGSPDVAGGRFRLGWSLDDAETIGIEGSYFFLGSRTLTESVGDLTQSEYRGLGLPFVNAVTGLPDVLTVAQPGLNSDLITVAATTRVQGAEFNGVASLYADTTHKISAIGGYRFLQVNEGLNISQTTLSFPPVNGLTTLGMISDQFDGHNNFSGGQLGLHGEWQGQVLFFEWTAKAALGATDEVVQISGVSHFASAGNPLPLLQSFPGGVYALPSNTGRYSRTAFSVVPEAIIRTGFKIGDHARFFVGYNFLYLSNLVRPGDQIDQTINPSEIPLRNGGGVVVGPDRPTVAIVHTDFWVQGLVIGLQSRY